MEKFEDESMIHILNVNNFKSLNESIQSFLRSKGITKSFRIEKNKLIVNIYLRHADIAFELMKFLNIEEGKNPSLKGIKSSMQILQERESSFPSKNEIKNYSNELLRGNLNESVTNKHEKPHAKNKEIYKLNYKKYNEYEPVGVIQLETPYITEGERLNNIEREKKEKLNNKPRFNAYFDNATLRNHQNENYIDDPPKIPIHNFNFRDENKDKWITQEDFVV